MSSISMTTQVGLVFGGVIATVFLILLLSAKEILSATDVKKSVMVALDSVILPLLLVFLAIVVFKVNAVL
jgi:hypothetical protein